MASAVSLLGCRLQPFWLALCTHIYPTHTETIDTHTATVCDVIAHQLWLCGCRYCSSAPPCPSPAHPALIQTSPLWVINKNCLRLCDGLLVSCFHSVLYQLVRLFFFNVVCAAAIADFLPCKPTTQSHLPVPSLSPPPPLAKR